MTSPALIDELYFDWLVHQVGISTSSSNQSTYLELLKTLYTHEFTWVVPNDDNRAEDGRDLRTEFADERDDVDTIDDETWFELGCSMFELLVGLSRRLSFEADGEPREWFWTLVRNLGLITHSDDNFHPIVAVEDILQTFMWRTYEPSGRGGLFPLRHAREDQRRVELWYQLCAYVLEMGKF